MLKKGDKTIIGIDHGYGYIKSAQTIMKSGIKELPIAPPFTEDLLEFNGNIYVVGQTRTEHSADKTINQEYYILTLASMAEEMKKGKVSKLDNVIIAAGLPYSFISAQKNSFRRYLTKNKNIDFKYEGKKYHIGIKDAKIFPQGFPVIAKQLGKYKGKTVSIADIGSRTIDILTFRDGKPLYEMCFSIDNKGTLDCIDMVMKYHLAKFQQEIQEEDIQRIFQDKTVTLSKESVKFVKELIKMYIDDVMKQIVGKGVTGETIFCGGGATVVKNYYKNLPDTCIIQEDIHCNAAGYEMLAFNTLK